MPRRIRPDPTGAKGIERKMMLRLYALVVRFGIVVKNMVAETEPRALESPVSYLRGHFIGGRWVPDTGTLMQTIRDTAEREITEPGKKVANEIARMSFDQGVRFAEKNISHLKQVSLTVGIRIGGGYSPTDLKIIEGIYQRNLVEIKGVSDELAKRMNTVLLDGMSKGEGIRKMAPKINKVTEFGKKRSILIARTEVMRAVNTSNKERIRAAGYTMVEWTSAGDDGRTCEDCLALNGTRYPIDKAPDLPRHPNCRCSLLPIMTDEEVNAEE
jgi:SPP1 gp7 family putative phage head morphogenesis protein